MDDRQNDLWQGGPWEQPSRPVLNPPHIPQPARPVLRTRKRRRSLLPILIPVAIVAAVILAAVVAWYQGLFPRFDVHFGPYEGYSDDFPFHFPYDGYEDYDRDWEFEQDYTTPPGIPAANTGSGITIALEAAQGDILSYEQIYDLCAPSIVSITTGTRTGASTGTGIVLTEDGYLLTNAHVVAGGEYVEVVTFDNRIADAALVGFDAKEDLAVLKVDLTGLTPARFGSSDELRIGEQVAAIGDSLGYRSTITDGIISALDREVDVEDVTMTLIQTSAAINFGNSGGALIDRYGRVVGITTMKIISNDGSTESMGFAIPSTRVKYVADRLIAGEEIVPAALGITVNSLPVDGLGLEVLSVSNGSDAREKGLQKGDILLKANGLDLTATQVLTRLKVTRGAGDIITLTVQRGEEIFDLDVALTPLTELEGYS